jgi:hypothetical protein
VKIILRFWSGVTILKVTEICVGLTTAGVDLALPDLGWFTKLSFFHFYLAKGAAGSVHPNPALPADQGDYLLRY